jgi:CBS domain-containing protein
MAKTVRDAMSKNVRSISPSAPLAEAARVMREEDVGSLPVVQDNRLVGILTDRDIATRSAAEGSDPQSVTAGEVASSDLVTAKPDQDLKDALELMAQNQVRRLPVVEGEQLVGILAQADVAAEGGDEETGRMVEEISE